MAFQTSVGVNIPQAVPGQAVTPNQSIYTPRNYIAAEGGLAAGGFAFYGDDEHLAYSNGSALLGFVERVLSGFIWDITEGASLSYAEGDAVTIAVRGDYWVKAPAAVAVGDAVYADASTGAVASGGVDTGWTYRSTGEEGDMVMISNWGVGAGSSSSGSDEDSGN